MVMIMHDVKNYVTKERKTIISFKHFVPQNTRISLNCSDKTMLVYAVTEFNDPNKIESRLDIDTDEGLYFTIKV